MMLLCKGPRARASWAGGGKHGARGRQEGSERRAAGGKKQEARGERRGSHPSGDTHWIPTKISSAIGS
eukprot:scaffold56640_cov55-Phaeocystis_antarctica.AAC.2